jgi:hypothetical protein
MSAQLPEESIALLEDAVAAHLSADVPKLLQICNKALSLPGLPEKREARFRRFYAFALNGLSFQEGQNKQSLRKSAIEEARKAITLFGETAEPYFLAGAYEEYGSSLYLYSMTVDDLDTKSQLVRDSIQAYEKVLGLKPGDQEAQQSIAKAKEKLSIIKADQGTTKKDGGCFIATATYGSSLVPEVMIFRRFRDEVLLSSIVGKFFVGIYYRLSPVLASIISKSPFLRRATKAMLLKPLLRLLRK